MGTIYRNGIIYGNNPFVESIGTGGGYAPIGTIIAYLGVNAPQDYLVCDGSIYNITDYKQLSHFIETQFGSINKFGGDGITTFGVPDLRGEFLRGSGTNGHSGQGSGGSVGNHQDATEIPYYYSYMTADGSKVQISGRVASNGKDVYNTPSKPDASKTGPAAAKYAYYQVATSTASSARDYAYMMRPTNTAVLYCIKATCAGDVYSTSEREIGTWIDGKPLYQMTIVDTMPTVTTSGTPISKSIELNIGEIDKIISSKGSIEVEGNAVYNYYDLPYTTNENYHAKYYFVKNKSTNLSSIQLISSYSTYNNASVYITIQYTKVED